MNRVTAAITKMRKQIKERIASGITTPQRLEVFRLSRIWKFAPFGLV